MSTIVGSGESVEPAGEATQVSTGPPGPGLALLRRVPFTLGYGGCGDVITAVRHESVQPTGAFASYVGLSTGPQSNWRVGALPDSLVLAGYDLTQAVTVLTDTVIVQEGDGAGRVTVCLGATTPSADDVLTATPALGQLVPPPTVTFDSATWMIPGTVDVAAVDDAVIEPPQWDTLTYALTSADPTYDGGLPDRTSVAVVDDDGATDLELVLQNAPDTVMAGNVFEVVYRVTNQGPTLSTGSALLLGEQGAGDIVFQQAFGATCYEHPVYGLVCEIAGLAAGAQQVIAIVFQAATAGDVTLDSTLYSHQPDATQTDNHVVTSVVVN